MSQLFIRFFKDEAGATAIEYGLIAGLIAIAIVSALTLFGDRMTSMFGYVESTTTAAMSGSGSTP